MTLRQLYVRLQVILADADSPLSRAIERARADVAEDEQLAGMDAALNLVMPP